MIIYLNGRLLPLEDARISPVDRGFQMGDGVYETIRVIEDRPFRLEDHRSRLSDSLAAIDIPRPAGWDELGNIITDVAERNGLGEGLARITITRGEGVDIYHPVVSGPTFMVHPRPLPKLPENVLETGVAAAIVDRVRNVPGSTDPAVKSISSLNTIQAKQDAFSGGVTEGIMLNHAGRIAEGATSSVFWVSDARLRTPALDVGILPGITRLHALAQAREAAQHDQGPPVEEGHWGPEDLRGADEAFLTSTAVGILPLTRIDGHAIGNGSVGPVTRAAAAALERARNAFRHGAVHADR